MINTFTYPPRLPLKIRVAGEYCKVTGGSSWKGKALSGHKQNLVSKFCVLAGEFSDLRCLINTLTLETNKFCMEKEKKQNKKGQRVHEKFFATFQKDGSFLAINGPLIFRDRLKERREH